MFSQLLIDEMNENSASFSQAGNDCYNDKESTAEALSEPVLNVSSHNKNVDVDDALSGKRNASLARATIRNASTATQRSNVGPTSNTATRSGKLHVAEPASFTKFFVVLVMYFCKKVLIFDTAKLAWFYMCVVTVASLITDLFRFPPSYFSDRNNLMNQYFVKLGLGWTLLCVMPFVFVTSYILSIGRVKLVYKQLARFVVVWLWWFFATYCMSCLEALTGECSKNPNVSVSKSLCRQNGGQWKLWLDISGHSFLLVFCILIIAEETSVFDHWSSLSELLRKDDSKLTSRVSGPAELAKLKFLYVKHTPVARIFLVGLACLQVTWNTMLLATVVYFHNMPDKLCGALTGVAGWFIIYRIVCGSVLPPPIVLGKKPLFQHLKP